MMEATNLLAVEVGLLIIAIYLSHFAENNLTLELFVRTIYIIFLSSTLLNAYLVVFAVRKVGVQNC
jgi:hypothetical protein